MAGFFTAGTVLWLLVLGVGFVVLSFLVYAGLCAAVGGFLVFLLSRRLAGRLGHQDPPAWMACFVAAYWGYLIALLIDTAWSVLGDGGGGAAARAASSASIYPETIGDVFAGAVMRDFASWLWPAIPITTLVLFFTHRMYRGPWGVVRGLAVTVISLPASLLLPLAILVGWQQRLTGIGGLDGFGAALLAIGVLLLVHAVLGGLFGAPVLLLASRRSAGLRPSSPWRSYLTAVLTLLVWGVVTAVTMFLIPAFDPFSEHLWEMAHSPGAVGYVFARPWLAPAGVITFGLLQTPGVLVAARVVDARLGVDDLEDRRNRCVTATAVAATWPLALAIAWLLASAPV